MICNKLSSSNLIFFSLLFLFLVQTSKYSCEKYWKFIFWVLDFQKTQNGLSLEIHKYYILYFKYHYYFPAFSLKCYFCSSFFDKECITKPEQDKFILDCGTHGYPGNYSRMQGNYLNIYNEGLSNRLTILGTIS